MTTPFMQAFDDSWQAELFGLEHRIDFSQVPTQRANLSDPAVVRRLLRADGTAYSLTLVHRLSLSSGSSFAASGTTTHWPSLLTTASASTSLNGSAGPSARPSSLATWLLSSTPSATAISSSTGVSHTVRHLLRLSSDIRA